MTHVFVTCRNIAFVSGTMVAVLAALSIWDEDVLNVEHVFFMLTVFTVIVAGCRSAFTYFYFIKERLCSLALICYSTGCSSQKRTLSGVLNT